MRSMCARGRMHIKRLYLRLYPRVSWYLSMQICLPLTFCRVIPPCVFFNLPRPSPGSFYRCLPLPFYPTSCLFPHPPFSFFPSHHPFAPILSTPRSELWSDHIVNLIKRSFIMPLSFFPGVFSWVSVCACEQYLSLLMSLPGNLTCQDWRDVQTISTSEMWL